mmetsp:Transcript_7287/g.26602  ORF Transcript_7287/g.26602 Transcript_7287/m.26602 type:complete len:253 (+) Transcript_7287:1418-2176(+)
MPLVAKSTMPPTTYTLPASTSSSASSASGDMYTMSSGAKTSSTSRSSFLMQSQRSLKKYSRDSSAIGPRHAQYVNAKLSLRCDTPTHSHNCFATLRRARVESCSYDTSMAIRNALGLAKRAWISTLDFDFCHFFSFFPAARSSASSTLNNVAGSNAPDALSPSAIVINDRPNLHKLTSLTFLYPIARISSAIGTPLMNTCRSAASRNAVNIGAYSLANAPTLARPSPSPPPIATRRPNGKLLTIAPTRLCEP